MFCTDTNVLQDSVHEERKSEEIIPSVRGVCGCISLADVNFKAESRIVIKNFFFILCYHVTHYITLYFCFFKWIHYCLLLDCENVSDFYYLLVKRLFSMDVQNNFLFIILLTLTVHHCPSAKNNTNCHYWAKNCNVFLLPSFCPRTITVIL